MTNETPAPPTNRRGETDLQASARIAVDDFMRHVTDEDGAIAANASDALDALLDAADAWTDRNQDAWNAAFAAARETIAAEAPAPKVDPYAVAIGALEPGDRFTFPAGAMYGPSDTVWTVYERQVWSIVAVTDPDEGDQVYVTPDTIVTWQGCPADDRPLHADER